VSITAPHYFSAAEKRDSTVLALPERDQLWRGTLISGGWVVRFVVSLCLFTPRDSLLSEVVQFSTRGCELVGAVKWLGCRFPDETHYLAVGCLRSCPSPCPKAEPPVRTLTPQELPK